MEKAQGTINVSDKPVTIDSSSARDFLLGVVESGKVKILALEEIYAKTNPSSLHNSSSPEIGSLCIAKTSVGGSGSSKSSSKKAQARKICQGSCFPSKFPRRSPASEISQSVEITTTKDKSQTSVGAHSPLLNTRPMISGVQEKHNLENTFSDLDKHAGNVNSSLPKTSMRRRKAVVATVHRKEDTTPTSTTIFKFGDEYLPNPPAVKASWTGNFAIHDFPGQLCDGFQAYPPGKVSSKAFVVSKQMPSVLQFTLQCRSNVWPATFKAYPPCGSDIAVYFLANDISGSRQYNQLLKFLEEDDLSMQSHLDGAELLVFTSKQLPLESQRMNKQFYLWGVFVSLKERQSIDNKGKLFTFKSPLLEISEDPVVVTHEVNTNRDTEIDMVGGREVGIKDISLRGNSISACFENSDIPSENVLAGITSDSVAPPVFSKSSVQIKVSPGALKVDTHSFSKPIKLEEWDSSPKVTHMEGGRDVGTVDKCCRKSMPIFQDNLDSSSENVLTSTKSSHNDTPPSFSKLSALKKMSPGVKKLNAECLSKPIKLEEKDSSPKCASESVKSIVVAQEDPENVVCMVCREGYHSRPYDMLGTYSYSKRVDLDIGTSASSRSVCVYTTISDFNIIHFNCHGEAGLKNPKNETEDSAFSSSEAIHTSIFPLKGPLVQVLQYRNLVVKYWDSLILLHGRADGNRFELLTYDILLMLSRFATGASFNTDTKCGGRESNAHFLPFMIQMAQCLVEKAKTLKQREAMANGISSYLSSTSIKSNSSAPPGFNRSCGAEETVQYIMMNSLFFESYDSWLAHRRAFLQHAIYHAYVQNKRGRPVLALSPGEICMKAELVDQNNLVSILLPMLVFIGLIEQLQRFLKLDSSGNAAAVKTNGNDNRSLEWWEVMKAKLVDVKEMLYFSKKLLLWLDDMKSTNTWEEAFSVMGVITDVLADEFSSCEEFVSAAIQSGVK